MKLAFQTNSTSKTIYIHILDSSSTVGAGLTGLTHNSASLVCFYIRPQAAPTAISLVANTITGGWVSGGFVEVSSTNMPGIYRFDIPDAVLASGASHASLILKGATNMVPVLIELALDIPVDLKLWNGYTVDPGFSDGTIGVTVTNTVNANLVAWNNSPVANIDSQGFIPAHLVSTDGVMVNANVIQWNSNAVAQSDLAGYPKVTIKSGTGVGELNISGGSLSSVATVTGNVSGNILGNVLGAVGSISTGGIAAASFASGAIDSSAIATTAASEIAGAVWDESRIGHTGLGTFGQGVASVQGSITGSVASVTGSVGSVTGSVGSVAGNVNGNVIGYVGSVATKVTADVYEWQGVQVAPLQSDGTLSIDTSGITATVDTDAIANAVWDEARSTHTTSGTFGEGVVVNSIANNAITNASIANNAIDENKVSSGYLTAVQAIVWNAVTASYAAVGTFGKKLKDWSYGTDYKALISTDTQNLASTLSVNIGAISGDTTVPLKLATSAGTMVISTAATGTLSTSAMTTNLSSTTDSLYVDRYVYFTSGSLTGYFEKISAYAGSTKLITFSTALISAPSNGDTFIIV